MWVSVNRMQLQEKVNMGGLRQIINLSFNIKGTPRFPCDTFSYRNWNQVLIFKWTLCNWGLLKWAIWCQWNYDIWYISIILIITVHWLNDLIEISTMQHKTIKKVSPNKKFCSWSLLPNWTRVCQSSPPPISNLQVRLKYYPQVRN